MKTYEVQGTLFQFPEEPSFSTAQELLTDAGYNSAKAHVTAKNHPEKVQPLWEIRVQDLLDKAAKVSPGRTNHKIWPDKISQHRCPKPGTGEWSPKPGDPGSEINGCEVWALAPNNHRWVINGDSYALVHAKGGRSRADYGPGDAREMIVGEMKNLYGHRRSQEFVPPSECPRMFKKGAPLREIRQYEADRDRYNARTVVARQYAGELIAHELYPSHYPHPGSWTDRDPQESV